MRTGNPLLKTANLASLGRRRLEFRERGDEFEPCEQELYAWTLVSGREPRKSAVLSQSTSSVCQTPPICWPRPSLGPHPWCRPIKNFC